MQVKNLPGDSSKPRPSHHSAAALEHLEVWHEPWIFVKGEIGGEGRAAIRRAVEHLQGFQKNIEICCEREVMVAERKKRGFEGYRM